jgi:DNA modification methylase
VSVRVLEGHVLDVLEQEQAGHYHVCVTSPPYWLLRAYATPAQVWDGSVEECEHEWGAEGRWHKGGGAESAAVVHRQADPEARATSKAGSSGAFCARCGAWRGELGQEPTPERYVAHLVECFRAVRRVLRDDGTLWVNLAGCYFNDPGGQNGGAGNTLSRQSAPVSKKIMEANRQAGRQDRTGRGHPWLKPLDWVDVPGLFARAMQQDGWLWRSDVTWVKPSALPESVSGTRWERCRVKTEKTPRGSEAHRIGAVDGQPWIPQSDGLMGGAEWADCPGCGKCDHPDPKYRGYVLRRGNGRPTKSTEAILQFAKKPGYYFDTEAVREALAPFTTQYLTNGWGANDGGKFAAERNDGDRLRGTVRAERTNPAGRNLRDWWVISPEPLKDAHYAAYPTALPDRCIRAGTSEWGCCPACGSPWARVVERTPGESGVQTGDKGWYGTDGRGYSGRSTLSYHGNGTEEWLERGPKTTTLGWRPTCRCPGAQEPPSPCRVLDPFGGSGATALAANRLGRDCVLVELKPAYAALARKRIGREPLSLFASRPEEVPV